MAQTVTELTAEVDRLRGQVANLTAELASNERRTAAILASFRWALTVEPQTAEPGRRYGHLTSLPGGAR